MVVDRERGSGFRQGLWRRVLVVLVPAALVLSGASGARAASRIYWGDCGSNTVSFANLNDTGHGGDLKTTGVTPNCPQGVAMDLLNGKIYWADLGQGLGTTISFANLNNTGGGAHLDTSGATMPSGPLGVATDPATGRIYWGDVTGTLSFAAVDNTGSGGDLSTSGATPDNAAGVAIDPATGRIYWTNYTADKISFANLDGTGNGGDLDTQGATVSEPEGLAIDPANGKIYWTNSGDNSFAISYANVNDTGHGGELNLSGTKPKEANGLAIDPEAGKIYWANLGGHTISFVNINDTGGGGELKTTGASPLDGAGFPALLKVPLATARPKLGGSSKAGAKLSCSEGKWAPDLLESFLYQQPVSFDYSWSRNGKPIADAAKNSITASRAGTYTCTVTAINEAGHTKKTSKAHKVKT